MLILGQRHLTAVLAEYARHHNDHRPHRALAQQPPHPIRPTPSQPAMKIQRNPILSGLINEYTQAA
jgi:putative transposase